MLDRLFRARTAGLLSFCALAAFCTAPVLAIDVPDPAWFVLKSADANYYAPANGLTGNALKLGLRGIIDNDTPVSYDNARVSQRITDLAYGTSTFVGVYDRAVLTPSSTSNWNREHVFPDSKIESPASNHDLFGLRPALTATNNGRGNNAFGGAYATGAPRLLAVNPGASTKQFFPGDVDKGDISRAMFFMVTRYSNLSIINSNDGLTSGSDTITGDLNSLLHWHYQDMPDNFERRRNQLIYNNTVNTSVSQSNRNPYVDHPEYVWSVFGSGANTSQIQLDGADTTSATGGSTKAVSFGRVIVGGAAPGLNTSIKINKTGTTPTTFSVVTAGAATADGTSAAVRTNVYNGFDYDAGSKTLAVGLTGVTTTTAGLKSGSVTLDNTDLTSSAAGTGSADGNDTVNMSLAVLDHANASFATGEDSDTLFLNFQNVDRGKTATLNFGIANLLSASGFTAGLDLDTVTATGDTGAFASNLAGFAALAAGDTAAFTATFTPDRNGMFYATYTLGVSDENLSGATAGNSLTIVMSGITGAFTVPEPAMMAMLSVAAGVLLRRRARAA